MKTLKRLACAVMVAGMMTFLWAPSGMAAFYETSDTFSTANEAVTLEYWNTDWGVLNSVTVTFDMDILSSNFTLINNTGNPASGTASFNVTAALTSPGVPPLMTAAFATIGSGADRLEDNNDFIYNLAHGESVELGGLHYTDSTTGLVGAMFTASYQGVGTYTFNVAVDQSVSFIGQAVTAQIDPASDYSGTVTVSYDYTPTVTVEGRSYEIVTTEPDHFGVGLEAGEYFTADGSEVIDANNTVLPIHSPAATGSLIVSTLGGATRSWTSVDTGFNPNLECDWKIYRVR